MTDGGKGKGPTKPFLGDEELVSELDAWDATFDALHGEPEAGTPANQEVMAWPEPAAPPPEPPAARVPDAAVSGGEASRTFDDFSPRFPEPGFPELELDEDGDPMTIEVALPEEEVAPERAWEAAPDETDFSALGAEAPPAALGEMLGGEGAVHRATTSVSDPEPFDEVDDDDVYTSASRPNIAPGPDPFPDDPLAPPPAAPRAAPKRTPAIIRRTGSAPVQRATPSGGYPAQHVIPRRDVADDSGSGLGARGRGQDALS